MNTVVACSATSFSFWRLNLLNRSINTTDWRKLVSSVPFLPTSDVRGILVCLAAGGLGRERVGVGCLESRPLQSMLPAALSLSLV